MLHACLWRMILLSLSPLCQSYKDTLHKTSTKLLSLSLSCAEPLTRSLSLYWPRKRSLSYFAINVRASAYFYLSLSLFSLFSVRLSVQLSAFLSFISFYYSDSPLPSSSFFSPNLFLLSLFLVLSFFLSLFLFFFFPLSLSLCLSVCLCLSSAFTMYQLSPPLECQWHHG